MKAEIDDTLTTIAEEITMIRKLAIFALLNSGASQEKIAAALGVSQATVSRLAGASTRGKRRAQAKKKLNGSSVTFVVTSDS